MSGNANESYLFIIDVSPTMGDEDESAMTASEVEAARVSKLEQALAYVELKLTQFIMRGLKTLEAGVMIFGSSKTNNRLTDTGRDGYEGIRLLVPIMTADNATLERVHKIKPAPEASSHPADLLSALICGADALIAHVGTKKKAKNLILVTDAECPTAWDHTTIVSTASHMNANGVELTVVGIDFDDPEAGFKEETKSEMKAENEARLKEFNASLDNSLMGNLTHAIRSAGGPQMKITQSRPIAMLLSIGNRQEEVEGDEGGGGGATTLALQVQYRKATAKAANPRAYKLSMLDVKPDRPPADLYDPHLVQARLGEPKTDTSHYALAHDDAQKGGLQGFELMFADFNSTANRREAVFQRELDKLQQEEAERTMDLDQDESTQSRQAQADTLTHEAARGFSRYIVPPVSSEEATATESEKKKQDPTAAASAVQGSSKDGAQSQQPPPQPELKTLDMNVQTSKAYMYGGTVVPIDSADAELSLQLDLKPGIEVIGFTNKQKLRRDWIMGEVGYINAAPSSSSDQVLFSALCSTLEEKGRYAIVRYIGTTANHPLKVGLLLPRSTPTTQYLVFVQMPFSEDLRKPKFPSLTNLTTVKGRKLTEHATIPTEEQNQSMASFVDAMDLDSAGADDEGDPAPWFVQTESYNPAIHNITMAVAYRHAHPLDPQLPVPHPELLKYMLTPDSVLEKASSSFASMREAFDVKQAPIKLTTGRGRKRDQPTADKDEEIDFDDFLGGGEEENNAAAEEDKKPDASASKTVKKEQHDESATEDEADEPPPSKKPKSTPQPSTSSLISPQRPLEDFDALVAPGSNMVTEAVRDMLVQIPFMANSLGGRQWDLAATCLDRCRAVASLEEEADQYNTFLREFKQKCKDSGGGRLTQFWKQKLAGNESRGLIHQDESEWSSLDKAEAEQFIHESVLA